MLCIFLNSNVIICPILRNRKWKRVVVAFRGSATPRDFMVDADGSFRDLDNPLDPESKVKLGVHNGFFGESSMRYGHNLCSSTFP